MPKKQKGKAAPPNRKRPKQSSLPGMENRSLKKLDDLAHEYADVRDDRMELTKRESELQNDLLTEMKKHKIHVYKYGDVRCEIIPEHERVKVKIATVKETDERIEEEPKDEESETTTAADGAEAAAAS